MHLVEGAFLEVSLGKLVVRCYPLACQIGPLGGFWGVLGVRKLFAEDCLDPEIGFGTCLLVF